MANFLYPNAKKLMLTGQFNWLNDNICIVLIASGQYTPSTAHQTLADIPASARVAISDPIEGKTVNINVVDANDYQFSSVSGPIVNAVILISKGTSDITSPLICYLDTAISGLPFTPANSSVVISWDDGPNKIFSL